MKTLTINLFDHEYDVLSEITEDFLGDEYAPENELAGMGTVLGKLIAKYGKVFVNPELDFKIQELAKYHEMGTIQLMTHLVRTAYIEAENAGVVPVDPWERNPNPELVLENNLNLWYQFPEALRDLHIEHGEDCDGDESGDSLWIEFTHPTETGVNTIHLSRRSLWDLMIEAYNPRLGRHLNIAVEIRNENGDLKWTNLDRMKNLDQLFNAVFGKSVNEFRMERGYAPC